MPVSATTPEPPLPTIWELPDELWERIEPILLSHYPPAPTGRPRADLRLVFDGSVDRMRSGCQWNRLPRRFGPSCTVHAWFQSFVAAGVLRQIWASLLAECEELGALSWQWQARRRGDGEVAL